MSHLGLPSSLGISGGTDKSFDILMKYPWLLSPFPYKWEDASKPASPTGFMWGDWRILEREVELFM